MANTHVIKTHIEPFVREWLKEKEGQSFDEVSLKLTTGGTHKFDAVSYDRSIVAAVKTNEVRPDTKKVGTGPIHAIFHDLYLLSLVEARKKYLVVTDKEFFKIVEKKTAGKRHTDTEIKYCQLSEEMRKLSTSAHRASRDEIGKR